MATPTTPTGLATLPSPPPTLPPWAKVLWFITETVAAGILYQQFDYGAPFAPTGSDAADPTAGSWRRFEFRWEDEVSGDLADDQYFTIDLANITDGNIDGTWTDGDYQAVNGQLGTMTDAICAVISTRYTSLGWKAYIKAFNPYSLPKPFAESGAPEYVQAWTKPGMYGGFTPPQPTSTVTEMTASRANWGRFYLPTLGGAAYGQSGRVEAAVLGSVTTAVGNAYTALYNAGYIPVVPTTSVNRVPTRTLQSVSGIRMDDVADVHRSRRHKSAQSRVTVPVA